MIPISKPFIGEEEKKAVLEVLESGMLVQGPRTDRLEGKFAEICHAKYAIATSSGTAALHCALMAQGIGKGDEVITTPFTFIASVNAIIYVGARPVFVDIEEDTFNINPALIEKAITGKTKGILPVHLYGYPCNMGAIMAIAAQHKLIIIEDAAQAVGAECEDRRVGSFGTGCFSLYATKNIMCGEGGMITTNDEALAQRLRMIRNHGMQQRYIHEVLGYNYRMTDIHAAIGLAQIQRLDDFNQRRRLNAEYLNSHIKGVIKPSVRAGYKHVWHQYTIRVFDHQERDAAVKKLNEHGIGTGVFYPITANKQKHLIEMGCSGASMPIAEKMARQVISLPVHPQLSAADLERIVTEVNRL